MNVLTITAGTVIKFENIIDDLINGNISDYKKAVKKLNKYSLIQFILFCKEHYNRDIYSLKILDILS